MNVLQKAFKIGIKTKFFRWFINSTTKIGRAKAPKAFNNYLNIYLKSNIIIFLNLFNGNNTSPLITSN